MGILELSGHYDNSIHPLYSALSTFLRCRMASTVWKGHLTFGLVSIPVKLFRAARAEKVSFRQLHAGTGGRVRQSLVAEAPPRDFAYEDEPSDEDTPPARASVGQRPTDAAAFSAPQP